MKLQRGAAHISCYGVLCTRGRTGSKQATNVGWRSLGFGLNVWSHRRLQEACISGRTSGRLKELPRVCGEMGLLTFLPQAAGEA